MSRQVIKSQGNNICKSASLAIHYIGKITNHSDQPTAEKLVHAFVTSSDLSRSVGRVGENPGNEVELTFAMVSCRSGFRRSNLRVGSLVRVREKKIGCVAISMREELAHSSRAPQLNFPGTCTSEPEYAN